MVKKRTDYTSKTIEFYDKNVDEYMKQTDQLQELDWLKKFSSYLAKNSKVLDLGCGYGRDCRYFVKNGFETYGVDLSSGMIKKARQEVKQAKFFVMNVLDLKFQDNFFDGIWCSATLVHLFKKNVLEALGEIYRVLKNGGTLYLNLKEGEGEKLVKDERYGGAEKFYSYFKEDEIRDLIAKSGFEMLSLKLICSEKKYNVNSWYDLLAKKI